MDDGSATTDLGSAGVSAVGLTGGAKRTDRGKGIGTKKEGGGTNVGRGAVIAGGGIGGTGSRSTGCGTSRPPPTAAAGKARQTISTQV
jgi:hypothetical protein